MVTRVEKNVDDADRVDNVMAEATNASICAIVLKAGVGAEYPKKVARLAGQPPNLFSRDHTPP